jgi:phage baseplate assembly protein W|tara:strand:+ start:61 stop:420 length:360 start_codon:yes stop_codon:yes gene_type:complete
MSFQVNPLTDDLIAIKNQTAIARSIRNLVLTSPGERFFNNDLGSRVNELLFENVDDITASSVKSEIENTIKNYEPRVKLLSTRVSANPDAYEFDVTIRYEIVGIEAEPQQLSFALQPTR